MVRFDDLLPGSQLLATVSTPPAYRKLKPEISRVLRSLRNASREEGMGLCFVGERCCFKDFLGTPVFSAQWNLRGMTFVPAHRGLCGPSARNYPQG